MKLSHKQIQGIYINWFQNYFHLQRFGQFFLNQFPNEPFDQDIYYEKNPVRAIAKVLNKYGHEHQTN